MTSHNDAELLQRTVTTKNAISRRLLSSLSNSPLLLDKLFQEFTRGCVELSELNSTDANDFSKEVASDLYTVLVSLSRLATYAERLKARTPELEMQRREFIERINNAYSEERSDVLKPDIELTRDPESGLYGITHRDSLNSPFFKVRPMSALDVMQGYGYDHNNEEEGVLAPFLWFGNQHRSPTHAHVRQLIADWMTARRSHDPLRVLDIGTGSCTSLLKLSQQVSPNARLYGCDICGAILASGVSRLMDCNVVPHLLVSDAQYLPYRDETFDIVVNFGSIDQIPDTRRALTEMFRVLKPGGLGICRDEYYNPSDLPIQKRAWYGLFGATFGRTPPPMELIPSVASDVKFEMLNELNFILSFKKSGKA